MQISYVPHYQVLRLLTLGYLLLPNLIFLATWVRPGLGGLSTSTLLLAFGYVWYRMDDSNRAEYRLGVWVGTGALALGLALLMGFGEFRGQTLDVQLGNMKYYDLATRPWPVYYDTPYNVYLCYYTGFYLPVAAVCKALGLAWGRYAMLAWTVFGLTLILVWVVQLSPRRAWLVLVLLLLFSDGWVVIAALRALGLTEHLAPNYISLNDYYLVLMSPFSDELAWMPQHTLPALLGGVYLTHTYIQRASSAPTELALLLGSMMLWSPFAVIGLAPLVAYLLLRDARKIIQQKTWWLIAALITVAYIPVMAYLSATYATTHQTSNRFIWQVGVAHWWLYYLLYITTNFVIWYLAFLRTANVVLRRWAGVALMVLCLLPLYGFGRNNDLQARGNIGPLLALLLPVCWQAVDMRWSLRNSWIQYAVIAYFLVNALSPLKWFTEHLLPSQPNNSIVQPSMRGARQTLEFLEYNYNGRPEAMQYALRPDSYFQRYFMP